MILRKFILPGVLFLFCSGLAAQEICDNGMDDDGDGLVDLNDPACVCLGIFTVVNVTDMIPNPDFEDLSCCPGDYSEMDCLDSWVAGTGATTDFMHTCDFIPVQVEQAGLVPFPSGSGAVGGYAHAGFKEYAGVCLNLPLASGGTYTFTIQVGAAMVGPVCPYAIHEIPPTLLTIYGNAACDFPVITNECPSSADPNWVVIGTAAYQPNNQWQPVSFLLNPSFDVAAIMIGAACNMPPEYASPCFPYFVYDDIMLEDGNALVEVDLIGIGQPCNLDYFLSAFIDHQGGQWQWYYNGVAISGQTNDNFYLEDNGFQPGLYSVTYTTSDGCSMKEINLTIPPFDTTYIEANFCPGESVSCAGTAYDQAGEYYTILEDNEGCDSIVVCIIDQFDLVPVTHITVDTCAPFIYEVCGFLYDESGLYQLICKDERGCDSTILLDLRIMHPEAYIYPPDELICDPNYLVQLDGSGSSTNPFPQGSTTYKWTGPVGGFAGPQDQYQTKVSKPGQYCLEVTFELDGSFCSNIYCVDVESDFALPPDPLVDGPQIGCIGDTFQFNLIHQGPDPAYAFEWILPNLDVIPLPDPELVAISFQQTGTYQVCGRTYNECGPSDTTCVSVRIYPSDSIAIQTYTCDTSAAGVFVSQFLNSGGCDSTVITTIQYVPDYVQLFQSTTCNPSEVQLDTVWMSSQYGCDSIIITQIDLMPSHQIHHSFITCDSLLAGLDTFYLQNQYGCDSIVFEERIYNELFQQTETVFICGSGNNYTDSLLVTSGICDSLFMYAYVYIPYDTTWLQNFSCNPSQVGVTQQVYVSQSGCDSVVFTNTQLLPSHDIVQSGFTCEKQHAKYEVFHLTNQYGCDSIVTIDIQYVGIDTQYVHTTTCDPGQAGVSILTMPGPNCDTIIVMESLLLPTSLSEVNMISCDSVGPSADTLLLSNVYGCDSLVIRSISYVNLKTGVQVIHPRCVGLENGEIVILHHSGGQPPIEYRLNDGNWQSTSQFSGLPSGTFTVMVRDASGCMDTLSDILVEEGLQLIIDAGPDHVVQEGSYIKFVVTGNHPMSQLQWSAIDPLTCGHCTFPMLGPVTTSQSVLVSAQTADGCVASDEVLVSVVPRPLVYIPNGFTPNNDGINDVFTVYGNEQVVGIRNLAIYDRWGNALYFREELPINDPAEGWDGTFRGQPMDPAVFVYVVVVELSDGSTKLYKGDVTLLR